MPTASQFLHRPPPKMSRGSSNAPDQFATPPLGGRLQQLETELTLPGDCNSATWTRAEQLRPLPAKVSGLSAGRLRQPRTGAELGSPPTNPYRR
jgi:hypothetical protein